MQHGPRNEVLEEAWQNWLKWIRKCVTGPSPLKAMIRGIRMTQAQRAEMPNRGPSTTHEGLAKTAPAV
jgi:hypothetical protein